MTPAEVAHHLQSLAEDQSQLRQLNALIKPLRIVRDRPRATVSLLVDAAKVTNQQAEHTKANAIETNADDATAASSSASSPHQTPPPQPPEDDSTRALSPKPPTSAPTPGPTTSEEGATGSATRKRKREADGPPEQSSQPTQNKTRNLSTTNLLSKANRRNRQQEIRSALSVTTSHGPRDAFVLEKWSPEFESLDESWESLLASYPSTWTHEQKLSAVDEALFKAKLLQPEPSVLDFVNGLSTWTAQWINPSQRLEPQAPLHLRGKKEFQDFWIIDRNVQTYQSTNVITSALLRLSKVRLAEKYEELKRSMSIAGVKRRRGQTAAAKAKEVIFETTFPNSDEREAAQRRFAEAQHTSAALLELCREHTYGVLILIPPGVTERDLRSTTEAFQGFRAALRLLLSSSWAETLKLCGEALVALSQGQQPSQDTTTRLAEEKARRAAAAPQGKQSVLRSVDDDELEESDEGD